MSDPLYSIPVPEPTPVGDEMATSLPPTSQQPSAQRSGQGLKLAKILVLIGALGIAAVGLLVGGLGLLATWLNSAGDTLSMVVASVSFAALSLGLGLSLAWQAGQAIAGRPSSRFQPRWIGLWILLFLVALALGQLVLSTQLAAAFTFPIFHIAVATLPPLLIVALMGRALGGATRWRDVILELGSGAFLSTALAFVLEFVAILAVAVAAVGVVALLPGGMDTLQAMANRLQDPAFLQDPANLTSLVATPLIAIVVLLFTAGIIPIIEETVKTLGVGLLAYRRPSMPQAVVWGLACGAGFAMAEALFNTIGGLDGWAGVALLRVGASLLHCFTGGLMGLAWYYLLAERRWGRTIGLYAAAIALHGLWNALATSMTLVSLLTAGQRLGSLGSLGVLVLLVLLALGQVVGLVALARYAARHRVPSQESPASPDAAATELAREQA